MYDCLDLESKLKEQYKYNDSFCLGYDGDRLKWTADFKLLKLFVDQIIELRGKWTSPGGNAKKFICNGSDTTLTWYPGKQNTLILHGEQSYTLRNKLLGIYRLAMNDHSLRNKVDVAVRPQSLELCNLESQSELTRPAILCAKDKPVNEEVVSANSQTIKDLEDFIDESFQKEVLSCSVNGNKTSLQITDHSTPSQVLITENPVTAEEFCTFKQMEIEFVALKQKSYRAKSNYL